MKSRIESEKSTITKMIGLYCRKQHHSERGKLCEQCEALEAYAMQRLTKCVYGNRKPTCSQCPVHCYSPLKREEIKQIMRFSGPRMPLYHPIHFMVYLARKIKGQPKTTLL